MKILVASKRRPNKPGRRDGGVQTWIATVTAELRSRGHRVTVSDKDDKPSGTYEVGIFANAAYTGRMKGPCERTTLVCHGIVPDEAPADGFDRVLYSSEEVRAHWGGSGDIVRQPVDLRFWRPNDRARGYLTRFANRGGLEMLPAVAARHGLEFVHARGLAAGEACKALWASDCVVATGRCAVEAMACGVPVVLADERHYQGPLLHTGGVTEWMVTNYSGRDGIMPNETNLTNAVYQAIERGSLREHAEQFHDVVRVADQLLEIAN